MIPGQTCVARLAERIRKPFIRKRRRADPPGFPLCQNSDAPAPRTRLRPRKKMGMFSRCRRDGYYVSYGSSSTRPRYICVREPDVVYNAALEGRVATTVRQTCASCGKFRSAKWEAAHPLLPGMAASSSLCGRCKREETSSEERKPKCHCKRRRRHRHSRRCTETTDESYCSVKDRRSLRRYRSDSREYPRLRASPRDNVRIVIANQPGERVRKPSTESSSGDGIRVIRRTSVVEVPERTRSRVRARSSSYAYCLDEDIDDCAEKLVRPRRRSRSRSLSQISCVEELAPRRSRHRRKSSTSRVQFVDDCDDPVIVSKSPKRISRRRAVYFDGAASSEPLNNEDRGRPRSRSTHHSSRNTESNIQPVEEALLSNSLSESTEGLVVPIRHRSSRSNISSFDYRPREVNTVDEEVAGYVPLHSRHPMRSNAHSEPENTPRPLFRHVTIRERADTAPEIGGHKRPHSETADSRSNRDSSGASHDLDTGHSVYQSRTPSNKRRRRYRDDSTEDDYINAGYRHVRVPAPSPPSPHADTDYLTQMLQSSHITPPSQQRQLRSSRQHGHGPPSPPSTRSPSRSESASAYRPPFYRDVTTGGTEYGAATYQYSPTEPTVDLYGNSIHGYAQEATNNPHDPYQSYVSNWYDPAAAREYDWMT